ncbi:hypothetical protein [Pseudomonas sp. NFR16]|uniref:hypothetical protein n=1 Tax=Pseudomonas sp. NFR16 TaxID=1566248 RepID=UPI00210CAA73|nr:hypothetical protein [Pseudomonas sp. NFR16]
MALFTEGPHKVSYRIYSPTTEYEVFSDSVTILIDKTAPGAPQLAPIIFPDAVQNGLTSSELEMLNNVLPGKIASYSGMAVGDVIRTYWGPVEGPMAFVDANDMGLNRVMVDFTRSFLEQADGLNAAVFYTVTDQAGNVSMPSDSISIQLQLSMLKPLPAPVIAEAKGDTLDPADTLNGATLNVAASANLREGETVIARFEGPKGSEQKEKRILPDEAGMAVSLVFSRPLVTANDGQQVEVSYSVTRASGIVQDSETLPLTVMSAALELPAPTMDTVGPDGILRPSLITGWDAMVRVSYRDMQANDLVKARWVGKTTFDTGMKNVGGMTELVFGIPKMLIQQSEGGSASVTYFVIRNGVEMESQTLALTVREGMMVDTTPVTLPGKIYLIPGHPDLLPSFPSGTTIKRVPSGGLAPYTFTTSDAKVAKVDAEGLVSVRGKGVATISVTDASGDSKSYVVTVTGVIECHGVGSGNYTQVSNGAARVGGRIPSIHELIEIHNAYGNRWPMGNANYWSSTVAKNVLGAKWYYVKNLITGKDYKLLHINNSLGVAIR